MKARQLKQIPLSPQNTLARVRIYIFNLYKYITDAHMIFFHSNL